LVESAPGDRAPHAAVAHDPGRAARRNARPDIFCPGCGTSWAIDLRTIAQAFGPQTGVFADIRTGLCSRTQIPPGKSLARPETGATFLVTPADSWQQRPCYPASPEATPGNPCSIGYLCWVFQLRLRIFTHSALPRASVPKRVTPQLSARQRSFLRSRDYLPRPSPPAGSAARGCETHRATQRSRKVPVRQNIRLDRKGCRRPSSVPRSRRERVLLLRGCST
jgi:hypothetical protein